MEKPILYTLLAVLLVCFLTSCQAPSDPPIAPPETTTGVRFPVKLVLLADSQE